jgi:hypothetical protein
MQLPKRRAQRILYKYECDPAPIEDSAYNRVIHGACRMDLWQTYYICGRDVDLQRSLLVEASESLSGPIIRL